MSDPTLVPLDRNSGSPQVPTGDPLVDGVGPATYTNRHDVPDVTLHGAPKIVPLRAAPGFWLEPKDPNPIGLKVKACDGVVAGVIVEAWVDRSEPQVRYYEVELATADRRRVMLPSPYVQWPNFGLTRSDHVLVKSINSAQFANVPGIQQPDQITLREEDRIMAYYAGGHLYATAARAEPVI